MTDHAKPATGAIRLWTGLALTAVAATAATAQPPNLSPATLTDGRGSIAQALRQGGPILVQADSGEAGEAGMVQGQSPELAYALRLALTDVHLHAAVEVYRVGLVPEAMGLAGHPEAEVMDDLRADLDARGIPDFSDDMYLLMDAIGAEKPVAEVEAAYLVVAQAIAAAYGDTPARARFDAAFQFARQAAIEYAEITAGGTVSAPDTYIETQSMIAIAGGLLDPLAAGSDATAEAARQAQAVLDTASEAYSAPGTPPEARDTTILYGVAARVELAGLGVPG
jgi:hypothetical protein